MNIARTLSLRRRSVRCVVAHLRTVQEEQVERLADLYALGRATDGQITHLARQVGLRSAQLAILEREARHAAS